MKENKMENLAWIIFASVGVILIVVAVIVGINTLNYDNKVDTKGIITEISSYYDNDGDRHYNVYVTYNVDGKEYESSLNSYSSSFYEGKEIDIYYDRNNPNNIGAKSSDLILVIIFLLMGLIFAVIGGIGIFIKIRKKSNYKKLKETGEKIYADYVETTVNTAYTVNGRSPYNIICEWNNPRDGKKYIFKSQNLWINPQNIIEERNIKNFPVYIGENNKYVVDIDILMENVVDLS